MIQIQSCGFRYAATASGDVYSLLKPGVSKLLKPILCRDGYHRVNVTIAKGSRKLVAVHRLIAEVYCENNASLPDVNHINGDKTDNRASNLEWVTRSQNMRHAVETGLHRSPPFHTKANSISVRNLRGHGLTISAIAAELGCCGATVHKYLQPGPAMVQPSLLQ